MQHNFRFTGLTDAQVLTSRRQYGTNTTAEAKGYFWTAFKNIVTEPMFVLLVATACVYSVLGELNEAIFMVFAIGAVSAISLFQERRSRKALDTLKAYARKRVSVLRNGKVIRIPSDEIVVGDFIVVEEGALIPADGIVRQSNDFTVNESVLTGESFTVAKDSNTPAQNEVYQGTLVSSGLALVEVTAIGQQTRLGTIGTSLESIEEETTPLQQQIRRFVRRMAIAGILVFLLIWAYNFLLSRDILDSLLKGLTLAMSILPEEIPVAFATFMALGAWRLMQQGIIVKQIKTVETLGSATVICIDKTGTITENSMKLERIYVHKLRKTVHWTDENALAVKEVIEAAMWASEPVPFDPMEKTLHEAYRASTDNDRRKDATMVHEYPLSGRPPMMTHIFRTANSEVIIAAKGAPEAIFRTCDLSAAEREQVTAEWTTLASNGYRVLGVAYARWSESAFPEKQEDFPFHFLGLVAFFDPPKQNIRQVLDQFYAAGLSVKIITGDNEQTTASIARRIGLHNADITVDGEQLMEINDNRLDTLTQQSNIFARMFPDAKLRVVNALKRQGHVVAMTGDGVNDAPALKSAHIGIAMGKRGTEVAKEASDMVLVEDDLNKMVEAISMGRKIYGNLKKAIQYIISIHIPIILTVLLPLFFGWVYPDIFTPVHVIFLELIMGPTCSIVYENEPMEKGSMSQPPRNSSANFLSWHDLRTSILQGLIITIGTLASYQFAVARGYDEETTRSAVFTTLVIANIFLTLSNRSFHYSILATISYRNALMKWIIMLTVVLLFLIIYMPTLNSFFHLSPLGFADLSMAMVLGFMSVIWFEGFKWLRRRRSNNPAIKATMSPAKL